MRSGSAAAGIPVDVLCLAPTDLRHDARVLAHARALGDAGHHVMLHGVLTRGSEPEEDHGPVVIVRTPVDDAPDAPTTITGAVRSVRSSRRYRPLVDAALARMQPDVVHAFGIDVADEALDAVRRTGAQLVLDDPGTSGVDRYERTVRGFPQSARRHLLERIGGLMRAQIDRRQRRVRQAPVAMVVTPTRPLAEHLVERFGGPPPLVIRDCFPVARRTDPHRLRVRLGTFPGERLIVVRGADGPGSGADAAVRMLPILGDGYVLVFIGLAEPSGHVAELARECGVTSRLRYVETASERETLTLMASADVAILPAEPQGDVRDLSLPPAVFECLAAAVPMAASDLPATGRLVRETGAGVLYSARSPSDPGALAEAVRTLLTDDSLRATCRDRARIVSGSELSWGRESQRLVEAYDQALQTV